MSYKYRLLALVSAVTLLVFLVTAPFIRWMMGDEMIDGPMPYSPASHTFFYWAFSGWSGTFLFTALIVITLALAWFAYREWDEEQGVRHY